MPFYNWHRIRNATRKEKLICIGAMVAIVSFIIILSVSLGAASRREASRGWIIPRDKWLAGWTWRNYNGTTERFEPLRLVIIQHTASPECHSFDACAAAIRRLHSYFLNNFSYDLPYTYMVGNDGRVYEGRGLGMVGGHTFGYNQCSIGLGFIGDYREEMPNFTRVTPLQVENVHRLLEKAVEMGVLHPDYHVVGARDLRSTESPGSNLYNEIQTWSNYDHEGLYVDKTCDEIHEMFQEST